MTIRRDPDGKIIPRRRPSKGADTTGPDRGTSEESGRVYSEPAENTSTSGRPMRRDGTGPMTRRPIDERFRCVYTKRDGERCGRAAIPGGTVCVKHGGRAPQIQRRARQRVAMSADRAIKTILEIMLDESKPAAVRLKAARDIADRNDMAGVEKLSVEMKPFEQAIQSALVRVVKVRVNEDGTEEEIPSGDRPNGIIRIRRDGVGHRRPTAAEDAEPLAIEGAIIDADVVSDEPDNVVPISRSVPPNPAMLSQVDLQDGRPGEAPRRRGRGTTPSEFHP